MVLTYLLHSPVLLMLTLPIRVEVNRNAGKVGSEKYSTAITRLIISTFFLNSETYMKKAYLNKNINFYSLTNSFSRIGRESVEVLFEYIHLLLSTL